MLNALRNAGLGLAALALSAASGPAQAAPTFDPTPVLSNSGNLEFSIFQAACIACTTDIEVVPFQENAFLIRNRATDQPLVALGDDLAIFFLVQTRGSFTLNRWMAQLVDAPNGSMGENITDEDVNPGFGFGNLIISGSQVGTLPFPYAVRLISGDKDLNAMNGAIGGVIQGLIAEVPAPAALGLFALGLAGLAVLRRTRV